MGIEITELREAGEDGGGLMGYFCKGHVDRYEFEQAANAYTGAQSDWDARHVKADKCRHEWWRCVPMAGQPGNHQYNAATPGKPGAFAVTVWDALTTDRLRASARAVQSFQDGKRQGLAEGVQWAINMIDIEHREAASKLLAFWRGHAGERLQKDATP